MIKRAEKEEYEQIRSFYDEVIDGFAGRDYHPRWEKDVYPDPRELRELLERGELVTGKLDGRIVAVMALNHECNEGYSRFDWPTRAEKEEVFVIHMLAVLPSYGRRGLAKEMVQYAIDTAAENGGKALRLDVLKGNLPANRLYESFGFQKLYTLNLFYPDTGWTDFELYELNIGGEGSGSVMKNAYLAGGCFWCIAAPFYGMVGIRKRTSGIWQKNIDRKPRQDR